MGLINKVKSLLKDNSQIYVLVKLLLLFLIVLTIHVSWEVYSGLFSLVLGVLSPFIIAFIIAYITHPLFIFMQSKKIPKGVAISIFWVVFIVGFGLIMIVLVPMIYDKCLDLISSLNTTIIWLSQRVNELEVDSQITEMIVSNLIDMLKNLQVLLPEITKILPAIATQFISTLASIFMVFIITIYMMIDYENVRAAIRSLAATLSKSAPVYMEGVDDVVGVYFRSLFILMIIKFVEYSFLYYIVGHRDWLIIGILTAIGLLVPFVGATLANTVGVVTALTLPLPNIIFLLLGIAILSNIDAYLIAPFVHSKRSLIRPLWTLFAVLAGNAIAGATGIFFAVPVYLAIRVIIQTYRQRKLSEKTS